VPFPTFTKEGANRDSRGPLLSRSQVFCRRSCTTPTQFASYVAEVNRRPANEALLGVGHAQAPPSFAHTAFELKLWRKEA
jgi:hypothetical protein